MDMPQHDKVTQVGLYIIISRREAWTAPAPVESGTCMLRWLGRTVPLLAGHQQAGTCHVTG